MFAVEPSGFCQKDVELRPVGISAVIGHRHPSGRTMTQQKFFVIEFLPEDALAWWM
jgi:hypothetical protein